VSAQGMLLLQEEKELSDSTVISLIGSSQTILISVTLLVFEDIRSSFALKVTTLHTHYSPSLGRAWIAFGVKRSKVTGSWV